MSSDKINNSVTVIKGKRTTVATKKPVTKQLTNQDKLNTRVPSRITVNNGPNPKKDTTKGVTNVISTKTKKVENVSTKPIVETNKRSTVNQPGTAKVSGTQSKTTGKTTVVPQAERRLSRTDSRTATKSRPSIVSDSINLQQNKSNQSVISNNSNVSKKKPIQPTKPVSDESIDQTFRIDNKNPSERPRTATKSSKKIDQNVQNETVSKVDHHQIEKFKNDFDQSKESKIIISKNEDEIESEPKLQENSLDDEPNEMEYSDDFEDYESDFEEYQSEDEKTTKDDFMIEQLSKESTVSSYNNKDAEQITLTAKATSVDQAHAPSFQLSKERKIEDFNRVTWEISLPPPTMKISKTHNIPTLNNDLSETMKRKNELMEIISLDRVSVNLYNCPPISYDIFIQLFGQKHVKQSIVQTIERSEASTQSDEILYHSKAIQCPASPGSTDNWSSKAKSNIDILRLSNFLEIGEKITKNILTCKYNLSSIEQDQNQKSLTSNSNLPKMLSYQIPTKFSSFQINLVHSDGRYTYSIVNDDENTNKLPYRSVIFLWNQWNPKQCEFILTCKCPITSIITGSSFLVFAGSTDGSISVWDLREPSYQHRQDQTNKSDQLVHRGPSFTTAINKGVESHLGKVSRLFYRLEANDEFEAARVLSLDENGVLIIWLISEINEASSSSADGLRPGSCIKLSLNLKLSLVNDYIGRFNNQYQLTCFDCSPIDCWNYLVGTNLNSIYKYSKYLEENISKDDSQEIVKYIYLSEEMVNPVSLVNYHPNHENQVFLAAYMDGSICLFSVKFQFPIRIWSPEDTGYTSLISLNWLSSETEMFIILDVIKGISFRDSKESKGALFEIYNGDERALCLATFFNHLEECFLIIGLEDSSIKGFNLPSDFWTKDE